GRAGDPAPQAPARSRLARNPRGHGGRPGHGPPRARKVAAPTLRGRWRVRALAVDVKAPDAGDPGAAAESAQRRLKTHNLIGAPVAVALNMLPRDAVIERIEASAQKIEISLSNIPAEDGE